MVFQKVRVYFFFHVTCITYDAHKQIRFTYPNVHWGWCIYLHLPLNYPNGGKWTIHWVFGISNSTYVEMHNYIYICMIIWKHIQHITHHIRHAIFVIYQTDGSILGAEWCWITVICWYISHFFEGGSPKISIWGSVPLTMDTLTGFEESWVILQHNHVTYLSEHLPNPSSSITGATLCQGCRTPSRPRKVVMGSEKV